MSPRTGTSRSPAHSPPTRATLAKAPTGIRGLDEITLGGLPRGRPTLVCGSAGCGKTLLATEFLLRGIRDFDEPGVLVTFEETEKDLTANVRSLGFDLERLVAENRLAIDHVRIDPRTIHETGEYDLEGLFVRLGFAIDSVGAKRVVLDTIESLFGGFTDHALLRAELSRLFGWLKERGVTAVVTGERGDGSLTRQGIEEYVSDCVILLDHRVNDQVSTRRLRIVKYRGSTHGTNEYPFLIDQDGISVLPITGAGLDHPASEERITSGIPRLDAMLGGEGFHRGSSILVSGTAGSGKTTLGVSLADATCARGERCLYLSFEESRAQLTRNMRSVGFHLDRWIEKGLLRFEASRPQVHGLEMHLVHVHKLVEAFDPHVVVLDPATSFMSSGTAMDAASMMIRLVDFLKSRGTTAMFVSLTEGGTALERAGVGISSVIDTWILLRDIESGGERNRGLHVLKSRGTAHSNQIREFLITSDGIELQDVYVGTEGVLTGSMRAAQESREEAARLARGQEIERRRREIDARRAAMEARVAELRAEFAAAEREAASAIDAESAIEKQVDGAREAAAKRRGDDTAPARRPGRKPR